LDAGVTPGSKDIGDEPWNNPTYLDDANQFASLREALERLRCDGKEAWLYDELGYPSGSAGGRVLDGHPQYQVEVLGCRMLRGTAGETIDFATIRDPRTPTPLSLKRGDGIALPDGLPDQEHPRLQACVAVPIRDDQLVLEEQIDLTDAVRAGEHAWSVPDGQWVVCLLERFRPDTWRRHNIPRRNVNILDRGAMGRFVELTHARYGQELGTQMSQVRAFFTDEPQFGSAEFWGAGGRPQCTPMVQWCDELPTRFHQKYGYDVHAILPALFHPAGTATTRHRHAFYDVQSDLVAENFFGQIEAKCRELGVASSGHMLLEESLLFHVMFSGSMLKNWMRMDLPGVDLLGAVPYHTMAGWNGDMVPVPEDFSCKLASSVAHLAGKQGTFTESFALAETATLRDVLGVSAWQFAGGITHMSTYTVQQVLSAEDYALFSDFVGRLALLSRRGHHVADVAVLVPERAVWATYTPPDGGGFRRYLECNPEPTEIDRTFRDMCHALLSHQRDFDCVSEDLLGPARIQEGRLHIAAESFGVLLLPDVRLMRRELLADIRTFLAAGGQVVFVGRLPCYSPERGADPQLTQEAETLLAEYPDQAVHVAGGLPLADMLAWIDRRVPARVRWQGPQEVRLLHRREPQRELLLLANPGPQVADGTLTSPAAGHASLWDCETGDVINRGSVDRATAVPLSVPARSARFLVVETAASQLEP
jgi:hypothetical protein